MSRSGLMRGLAMALIALLFVTSCSSEPAEPSEPSESSEPAAAPLGSDPIFGTQDSACESVRLLNEDDDQSKIAATVECLLVEIDAGRATTVDIAAITTEGDPIYMRYAFDGDTVLIVEDDRADTYGAGTVKAQRCASIRDSRWLPEGIDCAPADHPGFPEAPPGPAAIN